MPIRGAPQDSGNDQLIEQCAAIIRSEIPETRRLRRGQFESRHLVVFTLNPAQFRVISIRAMTHSSLTVSIRCRQGRKVSPR
jgi:hypothetical protein